MPPSSPGPTRRAVLGAGLGLTGMLLLSACTHPDTAVPAGAKPVPGGVLDYFEPQSWTVLYPPAGGFYPNGGILNNITARLLYQDPQTLKLYPWIATALPRINADATEYTFTLRPGITYSDGSALTAQNVVDNFELYGRGDKARGLAVSEQVTNYAGGEVLDEHTVRFRFSKPAPGFAQAVSTMNSGLLADATLKLDSAGFGPGSAAKIATCGPFAITAERVGTLLSVRAREDYDWAPPHFKHQGRAYLDGIDYRVNKEYSVRIGSLVSGQVQGVRDIQAPDQARIKDKGLQLVAAPTNGVNNNISLRSRHRLLADIRVRRALIASIDRQRILTKLFTDTYPLATGVVARGAVGYVKAPDDAWVHDVDRANALLDEAGWVRGADGIRVKDGARLALRSNTALPQPRSKEVMTLVQEDFARIGVGLSINDGDQVQQDLDSQDIEKVQVYHAMVARADYDVVASEWSINNRDALANHDEESGAWGDEEVERILARITGSAKAADRERALAEFQQHVIDQALVLPLFEEPQVFGFRQEVQGFFTEPVGRPTFYNTWLADGAGRGEEA